MQKFVSPRIHDDDGITLVLTRTHFLSSSPDLIAFQNGFLYSFQTEFDVIFVGNVI